MTFIFQTLNGLSMAALLFLLGAGFTMIFGMLRVTNLAHGAFYLLGGYIGLSALKATGIFTLAIFVGGIAITLFGLIVHGVMKKVQDSAQVQVLFSIGVAILVGDICLAVWGGLPKRVAPPEFLSGALPLGTIMYPRYRLFLIALGIIMALLMWLLLERTTIGTAIRAGVEDRDMVQAQGINIQLLFGIVFGAGAFLAGMAGVVGGGFLTLYPGLDWEILVLSLVVVVTGGLGNFGGVVLGSILVGLLDAYGRWLMPELAYFVLFAPMAILLMFRPSGLLGTR